LISCREAVRPASCGYSLEVAGIGSYTVFVYRQKISTEKVFPKKKIYLFKKA
jgi:hypothetical protein